MIKIFIGMLIDVKDAKGNGDILCIALEDSRKNTINQEDWIEVFCRKGEWAGWNIGEVKWFKADVRRQKNTRRIEMIFLSLKKPRSYKNELWKKEKKNDELDYE